MAKEFEINGIEIKTPDTFKPTLATTSTEDSDRTQDLVMHNKPMGTIEGYTLEWKNIQTKEAAKIVKQIKNKAQYKLRYMSASTGEWATDFFYSANYDFGTLKKANGKFVWESLSFQATSINPL